jgi:hypothetical protein
MAFDARTGRDGRKKKAHVESVERAGAEQRPATRCECVGASGEGCCRGKATNVECAEQSSREDTWRQTTHMSADPSDEEPRRSRRFNIEWCQERAVLRALSPRAFPSVRVRVVRPSARCHRPHVRRDEWLVAAGKQQQPRRRAASSGARGAMGQTAWTTPSNPSSSSRPSLLPLVAPSKDTGAVFALPLLCLSLANHPHSAGGTDASKTHTTRRQVRRAVQRVFD